jgi:hypothetical protein
MSLKYAQILKKDENGNIIQKDYSEFEKACRPLIKYLCENHHPHVKVIVTTTDAELLEGITFTADIFDYLVD